MPTDAWASPAKVTWVIWPAQQSQNQVASLKNWDLNKWWLFKAIKFGVVCYAVKANQKSSMTSMLPNEINTYLILMTHSWLQWPPWNILFFWFQLHFFFLTFSSLVTLVSFVSFSSTQSLNMSNSSEINSGPLICFLSFSPKNFALRLKLLWRL